MSDNDIVNDKDLGREIPVFPLAPGIDVAFNNEGIARLCNAQDLVPGLPVCDYEVAGA